MECTFSSVYTSDGRQTSTHTSDGEDNTTRDQGRLQSSEPYSYPVPFGHLPYNPSLPEAMGPLWSFPIEWWYYGGWAKGETQIDNQSTERIFTLFLETLRVSLGSSSDHGLTSAVVGYGIGMNSNSQSVPPEFWTNESFAPGFLSAPPQNPQQYGLVIPPTTRSQWYCGARSETMEMTCQLISGTLGLPGASYKLEIRDQISIFGEYQLHAVFLVFDDFGTIIELASGHNKTPSYEFAVPCLTIMGGSNITVNGTTYNLKEGNIWLDRQTLAPSAEGTIMKPPNPKLDLPLRHQPAAGQQLYIGNWLAIVMNDKTVYVMTFFWPKKQDQWIVGDKLTHRPPVPPLSKTGMEYPYTKCTNWTGIPAMQGVCVLSNDEFDLNIFDPSNPSKSPHWTSPKTKYTYCSKWQLQIYDNNYTLTALVQESEVTFGLQSFFEGAAVITDQSGNTVGHAMVEQMGYTN